VLLGVLDAISHSCGDERSLELCENAEHSEHGFAFGRGRVNGLLVKIS